MSHHGRDLEDLSEEFAELPEVAAQAEEDFNKPPDPEPLECWAAKKRNAKIISFWFSDKEEAERYCADLEYGVFLMREVTPQDEEKEKDAARYRKLKEIFRKTGRMWVFNPLEWDGELDKISGEREHERETRILGGPVPPVDHDITEP